MQTLTIRLGFVALTLAGCTKESPKAAWDPNGLASAPGVASTSPAPTSPAPHVMTAPADDGSISGTVVETMDAGGYTYAKIDRGTTPVWVAGPTTKLAVGMVVGKMTGTLMAGFRSNTLNRTFDQIYFINEFPVTGSAPANPHPVAGGSPTAPDAKVTPLEKAAGGQTIAEVFAGKVTLAGKPVVIRGKVVKVNNGILGSNWLHIQDGSGAAGTNDLTVTSVAETANLGDVVVVRGTVVRDKDFGAGYKYDVLIENAKIAAK